MVPALKKKKTNKPMEQNPEARNKPKYTQSTNIWHKGKEYTWWWKVSPINGAGIIEYSYEKNENVPASYFTDKH